jgi:hypothetical protein
MLNETLLGKYCCAKRDVSIYQQILTLVKVQFAVEQAMKTQTGSIGIALLFL